MSDKPVDIDKVRFSHSKVIELLLETRVSLLNELLEKAKSFERLTGIKPSDEFEKAVPVSVIKQKLTEIKGRSE